MYPATAAAAPGECASAAYRRPSAGNAASSAWSPSRVTATASHTATSRSDGAAAIAAACCVCPPASKRCTARVRARSAAASTNAQADAASQPTIRWISRPRLAVSEWSSGAISPWSSTSQSSSSSQWGSSASGYPRTGKRSSPSSHAPGVSPVGNGHRRPSRRPRPPAPGTRTSSPPLSPLPASNPETRPAARPWPRRGRRPRGAIPRR
jgi:hypothetical protein